MKWSTKIGRLSGIDIYIHLTFWLLIPFVGFIYWQENNNIPAAINGIIFVMSVFLCVLLHEFGHALTAKKFGINTKDITLLPIGGLARLQKIPENPVHELWITAAGPAVNAVIAILLLIFLKSLGSFEPINTITMTSGPFLERLMVANIALVIFNILPAFPMDGGRILRALLAMKMAYSKATQIAVNVGQTMAVLFGIIGLFSNPFLVIIALFVWIGATMEGSIVQMKASLNGIPVRNAMITDFKTLNANDTLSKVIDYVISGTQKDFPVMENDNLVGILTQKNMLKGLAMSGKDAFVEKHMTNNFKTIDELEMLESAFMKFHETECKTIPVIRNGKIIGLFTMDNLGEFMSIQSAIENSKGDLS